MAKLGECFSVIRNGASIRQTDGAGGFPITRIETIADKTINREKFGYAGIYDLAQYRDYILQDGDILMSHINSEKHLGKVALYSKQDDEQIIHGMNLLMLRADTQKVIPEYAKYYFESQKFLRQIGRITKKSVNQASFTVTALKELEIPLASIIVQRDISKKLKKVDWLVSLRKQQITKLDELVKARFAEMFGNKDYPRMKWNNVFNTTTGKLDSNAAVDNGKYPFFTCSKEPLKIDSYAFDQTALLLAGNNAAGKYDVKYYQGKFNAYQRTYVLSLKHNWSYKLFQYQLEDKLLYLQTKSLGGLTKYLTLKILGELDFIVPPLALQNEFATFVARIDQQKQTVQQSLDKLELMKKALMQEYFG